MCACMHRYIRTRRQGGSQAYHAEYKWKLPLYLGHTSSLAINLFLCICAAIPIATEYNWTIAIMIGKIT